MKNNCGLSVSRATIAFAGSLAVAALAMGATINGGTSPNIILAQSEQCRVLDNNIGNSYDGNCKDGLAHGWGRATGFASYKGDFRNGLPHGSGIYKWPDGTVFEGTFFNGKPYKSIDELLREGEESSEWELRDRSGCKVTFPAAAITEFEVNTLNLLLEAKWEGICPNGVPKERGTLKVVFNLKRDTTRLYVVHMNGTMKNGKFHGMVTGYHGRGREGSKPAEFRLAADTQELKFWVIDDNRVTYGDFLKSTDRNAYRVWQNEERKRELAEAKNREKQWAKERAERQASTGSSLNINRGCAPMKFVRIESASSGGYEWHKYECSNCQTVSATKFYDGAGKYRFKLVGLAAPGGRDERHDTPGEVARAACGE